MGSKYIDEVRRVAELGLSPEASETDVLTRMLDIVIQRLVRVEMLAHPAIDLTRLERKCVDIVTKQEVTPKLSWVEKKIEGLDQIEWYDKNGVFVAVEVL